MATQATRANRGSWANPGKEHARRACTSALIDAKCSPNEPVDETQITPLQRAINNATVARPINKAYCLGLGSLFQRDLHRKNLIISQLAAFVRLVKYLRLASGDDNLQVVAIDPTFERRDIRLMQRFGVTASTDTTQDLEMENSLVFAPFLPWPPLIFKYLASSTKLPAVLVTGCLEDSRDDLLRWYSQFPTDPVRRKGKSMIDGVMIGAEDWLEAAKKFNELTKKYTRIEDEDLADEGEVVQDGLWEQAVYVLEEQAPVEWIFWNEVYVR